MPAIVVLPEWQKFPGDSSGSGVTVKYTSWIASDLSSVIEKARGYKPV